MAQLALASSLGGFPEPTETIPDSSDGITAAPGRITAEPDGITAALDGITAAPGRITAEPDGITAALDGITAAPDGITAAPRVISAEPRFLTEAAKTAGAAKEGAPTDGVVSPIGMVELLIRSPARFLEQVHQPDLLPLVRTLVGTIVLGAGAFGAVVGTFRGGVQVGYCAVKVPLLLVGTMAVCTPSFIGLARAFGTGIPAREVVAVSLGAAARFALVLAGLAPVVWLVEGGASYHQSALLITAVCALAGVSASGLLFRGLSRVRGSGLLVGLAFVAVFGIVGGQTSWLLRPFLVRPRTVSVPFVRGIEGDLLDAVRGSARSAAGIYDEDHSP